MSHHNVQSRNLKMQNQLTTQRDIVWRISSRKLARKHGFQVSRKCSREPLFNSLVSSSVSMTLVPLSDYSPLRNTVNMINFLFLFLFFSFKGRMAVVFCFTVTWKLCSLRSRECYLALRVYIERPSRKLTPP